MMMMRAFLIWIFHYHCSCCRCCLCVITLQATIAASFIWIYHHCCRSRRRRHLSVTTTLWTFLIWILHHISFFYECRQWKEVIEKKITVLDGALIWEFGKASFQHPYHRRSLSNGNVTCKTKPCCTRAERIPNSLSSWGISRARRSCRQVNFMHLSVVWRNAIIISQTQCTVQHACQWWLVSSPNLGRCTLKGRAWTASLCTISSLAGRYKDKYSTLRAAYIYRSTLHLRIESHTNNARTKPPANYDCSTSIFSRYEKYRFWFFIVWLISDIIFAYVVRFTNVIQTVVNANTMYVMPDMAMTTGYTPNEKDMARNYNLWRANCSNITLFIRLYLYYAMFSIHSCYQIFGVL